jgi:hypothetical protein
LYGFYQANVDAIFGRLANSVFPYSVNPDYFLSRRFRTPIFRRVDQGERYDDA